MPLRPRTRVARRLRRDATEVEKRLWRALRELGNRFRRQHPIGRYIADFACPAQKLVIELDGGQHVAQEKADALRTAELTRRGYRVIRFWNGDVINNLPAYSNASDKNWTGEKRRYPLLPFRAERVDRGIAAGRVRWA